MNRLLPSLALTAPVLGLCASCLENEEEIRVLPDGSVEVTLRAEGDPGDLADGYALPLGIPWKAATSDTERWLAEVGNDTGSAAVQEREATVAWPVPPGKERPEIELAVTRSFPSVQDLPRWFAPESEPYRTAYLRRDTALEIRKQGGRRVFVFERTFHGSDFARLDLGKRAEEALPDFEERWQEADSFTAEEWRHVRDVLAGIEQDIAAHFVQDAIEGIYTQGDAALAPASVPRIQADVRAALADFVTVERLAGMLHAVNASEDAGASDALEGFVADVRGTIRGALENALGRERVAPPTIHAVLFALEWGFTSYDHLADLGDENFAVALALPGTLVGGNYDEIEDGRALWKFEGEKLQQGDVHLRAISVLE